MPKTAPKFVHAVYLPPVNGLPYLAARLEEASTDAVPFPTPEEAAAYNRSRPMLQTVPELYRRLLREALRELVEAKGEEALEGFRERARQYLRLMSRTSLVVRMRLTRKHSTTFGAILIG
jgi:hypothetical protein